ncbi:MAG TPA: polysaccharide deacetylase family protein [Bacilli bacterium]
MTWKEGLFLTLMFLLVSWILIPSKSITTFVEQSRIPSKETNNELLLRIQELADKVKNAPVNARLDPVWKAIPGYNGQEVDIEKTYKIAKNLKRGSKLSLVYQEIPPKVTLDQIGPYPIYKGNANKPMVSLMINVAWGNEFIPGMLHTLKAENVKATFFLDGTWLKNNQETAKLILQQGHELSNHGYSHKDMSKLNRQEAQTEIMKTQELLRDLGVENRWFAPPSGDFNAQTVQIAYELKLKTVLWTLDTVDWKNPQAEWVIRRISAGLEPGVMILMHPTRASSEALDTLIKKIKSKGLYLGTVSQLLSEKRVPVVESEHFW